MEFTGYIYTYIWIENGLLFIVCQVTPEACKGWVVVHDSSVLRHKWTRTHLERYFPDNDPGDPEVRVFTGEAQNPGDPDVRAFTGGRQLQRSITRAETPPPLLGGLQAKAGMSTPPRPVMQTPSEVQQGMVMVDSVSAERAAGQYLQLSPEDRAMFSSLASSSKNKSSVVAQSLSIKEKVTNWKDDSPVKNKKTKKRCSYPWATDHIKWEAVVTHLQKRNLSKESVTTYTTALYRFIDMVETSNDEAICLESMFINMRNADLFEELFSLPILDAGRSLSKDLSSAVDHVFKYLINYYRMNEDQKSVDDVMLIRDDVFPPFKKRVLEAIAFAKAKKRISDAERLENCAPISEIKIHLKFTFIEFEIVYRYICDQDSEWVVPIRAKQFLTCCAVIAIFFNGYASRPGGWERMLCDKVESQFEKGLQFVISDDYKTVKKYGPKAYHLTDGTFTLIVKYLQVIKRCRLTNKFLDPAFLKSLKTSVASMILMWQRHRLPEYEAYTATLVRKLFHEDADEEDKKTKNFQELCETDGHTPSVCRDRYIAKSFAKQAQSNKKVFEKYFGAPVEYPTSDEVEACTLSFDDIIARAVEQDSEERSGDYTHSSEAACTDDDDGGEPRPVMRKSGGKRNGKGRGKGKVTVTASSVDDRVEPRPYPLPLRKSKVKGKGRGKGNGKRKATAKASSEAEHDKKLIEDEFESALADAPRQAEEPEEKNEEPVEEQPKATHNKEMTEKDQEFFVGLLLRLLNKHGHVGAATLRSKMKDGGLYAKGNFFSSELIRTALDQWQPVVAEATIAKAKAKATPKASMEHQASGFWRRHGASRKQKAEDSHPEAPDEKTPNNQATENTNEYIFNELQTAALKKHEQNERVGKSLPMTMLEKQFLIAEHDKLVPGSAATASLPLLRDIVDDGLTKGILKNDDKVVATKYLEKCRSFLNKYFEYLARDQNEANVD